LKNGGTKTVLKTVAKETVMNTALLLAENDQKLLSDGAGSKITNIEVVENTDTAEFALFDELEVVDANEANPKDDFFVGSRNNSK
jgi:hypothetical protein